MGRPYPKETLDGLVKEYQTGKSLQEMYSLRGVSPIVLRKELNRRGIEVRRQKTAKEVIADLEVSGITRVDLARVYLEENRGKEELKDFIFSTTGHQVGDRCLNSILNLTNLQKPTAAVRELQGRRSREVHSSVLEELAEAGFVSLDSLGDYYTDRTDLDSTSLAELLNLRVGRETFTPRWIERHVISAGRTPRLRGKSRAAKSFSSWLATVYSGLVREDYRGLITPYEVDFYLEEVSIAVEFNGDYWHSDKFLLPNHGMTAKEYHDMKKLACEEKHVVLLFVWESDWAQKKEEVKTAVRSFLSKSRLDPLLDRRTPRGPEEAQESG